MGHIQSLISVEKRPQLPRDVFTKFNSKKVTVYYIPHLDNKHCISVNKCNFFPSNNK